MSVQVSVDEDKRRILFMDTFTKESCHEASKYLLTLTDKNAVEPIEMIINSTGGSCESTFGLLDIMAHIRPRVRTVGVGIIASCGLLLFMAGEPGYRRISSSAAILSHQFWLNTGGNYGELVSHRDIEDWTHERIVRHYIKHTKKSRKYIEKILQKDTDTWLKPSQAVRHGLADKIIRGNI